MTLNYPYCSRAQFSQKWLKVIDCQWQANRQGFPLKSPCNDKKRAEISHENDIEIEICFKLINQLLCKYYAEQCRTCNEIEIFNLHRIYISRDWCKSILTTCNIRQDFLLQWHNCVIYSFSKTNIAHKSTDHQAKWTYKSPLNKTDIYIKCKSHITIVLNLSPRYIYTRKSQHLFLIHLLTLLEGMDDTKDPRVFHLDQILNLAA